MKPEVFFLHNLVRDYRLPWFKEMAKQIDLTLILFRDSTERVKGFNIIDFKTKVLPHFKLFGKYGLSLSLIPYLLFSKYDFIVSDDLYFFETYIAFFISKLRRKKHIVWVETFEWPRAPRSKLLQPIIKMIARHSDAVVVVGKKSKEYLLKLGAQEDKIFISPDTSLCEVYNFEKNKKELYRKIVDIKHKQIILYLSRIMHYKGLDILVKAFAKLEKERNDVFLLICGDGPFKVEIKKLIQELNIKNIHFEDKMISPYEKGFYYSICDVFVLPSTFRDYDADCWGVVLNEAMSLGKPVISTDATGGAHDLIKQGINGFMVKEKDIEGLYNSLRKILSDKRLKEKMGKESKKIIENNFTYELMARGCIDAIMYTLSQKNLKEHANSDKL